MGSLVHQRCLHHGLREAVARCPECKQFFCRECITEHEDRVICAACLKKLVKLAAHRRFSWASLLGVAQFLVGILTVWLFFYCAGRALLAIPDSFHEGTVWESGFMDAE